MIELALAASDKQATPAMVEALEGAKKRVYVAALSMADGDERLRLAAALGVDDENRFATPLEMIRQCRFDVLLAPGCSAEAREAVLESMKMGLHVAVESVALRDQEFARAVARAKRDCLVKVAVADGEEDNAARRADMEKCLFAFADYLEEGLGDYPGKHFFDGLES